MTLRPSPTTHQENATDINQRYHHPTYPSEENPPERASGDIEGTSDIDIHPLHVFPFGGHDVGSHQAPGGARVIKNTDRDPRTVVPCTVEEGKELFRLSPLDNATYKALLRSLKVTGAQNSKMKTKMRVLVAKMVQRQFSINDALEALEFVEAGETGATSRLACIAPTVVRIRKTTAGNEEVEWIRGDVPVFDGEVIQIGEPQSGEGASLNLTAREPDFEACEYCRLLHVLADDRMTTARAMLMEPRSREELDAETVDPWSDHIAPLFNDSAFEPSPVELLAGGVTRSDIAGINTRLRPHERPAGVLKRKFAEFKSLYGICMSKYEASGQGDPDGFVLFANGKTYIMYAFCFLRKYPVLSPLATRALQSSAQREEGVGDGLDPNLESGRGSSKKRKREPQEISIVGIDAISSALKPCSEEVAMETEKAERDKAVFEASEAKGRSTQSLFSAISQAKQIESSAQSQDEKNMYAMVIKDLFKNLCNSEH